MLIKPVLASLLLLLTSNVVSGDDACGYCVLSPRSFLIFAPCGDEATLGGCLSWQGMCDWVDCQDDSPTPPPDPTSFPVCANDADLETCDGLFDVMYSRTMQTSCVDWFSYEEIHSDGFCYMCGGNTIPDIQQLLDGGCSSETIRCLDWSKQTTDEGTGWYKKTYCCHKDLLECVQFIEYVQDVDCNDETLGDQVMMKEPSCKFFTISPCPTEFDVLDVCGE
jgi:hypothetical protein